MSVTFKTLSANAFNDIQKDAGVILSSFDPSAYAEGTLTEETVKAAIVCTTTGGITVTATPSYSDYGEDVDNCPGNMMEFKVLDSWEVTMAFTAISADAATIKLALGAADVTDGKIVPRSSVKTTDYADIWWVGDKADGGCVAVKLINALGTGGLSMTSTKDGKGNLAITLTGHTSLDDQDVVPVEYYVLEAKSE